MTLIPSEQNLFVVDLHYVASFDDIEPELDAHVEFLKENYASGNFIASGPKVPRTGGVIIATAETREALERILAGDPFNSKKLARYTVTEFRPSMTASQLSN
ncbi:YciI family protein [Ahrensia sp. 13_GOM-1096m]|uniref:YciI family protein n=1 Tax=Ahrensia sp. 13_GOM-1096m TaxID=1380380 RepID=UPI00047E266F|nr:YciI family protein [Ahrensia sp. 13_GOM-1096m]